MKKQHSTRRSNPFSRLQAILVRKMETTGPDDEAGWNRIERAYALIARVNSLPCANGPCPCIRKGG